MRELAQAMSQSPRLGGTQGAPLPRLIIGSGPNACAFGAPRWPALWGLRGGRGDDRARIRIGSGSGFAGGSVFAAPILSGLISFTVAHASVGIGRRAGASPKPKAGASQSWKSRRSRTGGCATSGTGMTRRLPWNYGQRVRRGVALDDVDVSTKRTARPSPGGSPHARSMTQVWCL
jgi:hypothetical protein